VTIALETGCDFAECAEFAHPLYRQLARGPYDRCAVLGIPRTVGDWRAAHRTARKRANHARRLGYSARVIRRHEHVDELYAINTSLSERQGRPMSPGYLQRPSETPLPTYPCVRHGVHCYGVVDTDDVLRAYAWIYRAGDLALVSSILGHADHMGNDVMYLLFESAVECEGFAGPGVFVYNRWDSGTDGLRYFKSKLGFAEAEVAWRL
jgi:hypothetical protein